MPLVADRWSDEEFNRRRADVLLEGGLCKLLNQLEAAGSADPLVAVADIKTDGTIGQLGNEVGEIMLGKFGKTGQRRKTQNSTDFRYDSREMGGHEGAAGEPRNGELIQREEPCLFQLLDFS